MNNLITRVISGIVYAGIFIFCTLYSSTTYIGLISVFAILAIWEFSKLINFRNITPYLVLPLSIYALKENIADKNTLYLLIILVLSSLLQIVMLYVKSSNNNMNNFLVKLSLTVRYIILPFSFLTLLPFTANSYSPYLIIFIILLIWTNDSFAYLVGRKFGKRKLFERISPKKTIEGFLGGLTFSIIASCVLINIIDVNFNYINGIIIAIIVSVFGTFGDLVESKFKRFANVKDSGNIMPGHGGILDRLDSLFFLTPFVYLYIHYLV